MAKFKVCYWKQDITDEFPILERVVVDAPSSSSAGAMVIDQADDSFLNISIVVEMAEDGSSINS